MLNDKAVSAERTNNRFGWLRAYVADVPLLAWLLGALVAVLLEQAMGGEQNLRFIPLNVSAPFHSRFMNAIKDKFREVLNAIAAHLNSKNAARVTSNYTGLFHSARTASVIEALVAQLSGSVKWRDNMCALAEKSQRIYEIGPNRPLKNFFRSLDINCRSITSFSAAQREFAA